MDVLSYYCSFNANFNIIFLHIDLFCSMLSSEFPIDLQCAVIASAMRSAYWAPLILLSFNTLRGPMPLKA